MPPSHTSGEPLLAFGAFADAHYAPTVYGDRHCEDSLVKLRACIDAFNERELSLAVNLGDCIDTCESKEAELACLAEVAGAVAEFRGERRLVLGNHDLATFTKQEFLDNCGIDGAAPYYSFDHGGVRFCALDGNCHEDGSDFAAGDFNWADAWVSDEQVRWLEAELAAAADGPAVVLCHESLDHHEWQGELDPHVIGNHEQVRSVIERAGNVAAVIQGHYHPGRRTVVNGIPYITLAAMCVGPGLDNNAFAIVSLRYDGSVAVEGFGRQQGIEIRRA
ncbi:MAG: metallophosphoesterase [Planctomycetota bacterium]